MRTYLYFDSASTTPCCESAIRRVEQFSGTDFGNPSSSHVYGQRAAQAIREARVFFSRTFNVSPEQIIFTGSGTEADNLAIQGVVLQSLLSIRKPETPPRVIISAIEHPAVQKSAQGLLSFGVDVQRAPVDNKGLVDQDRFAELLTPSTALVSIMQVNNIVGSVQPITELAKLTHETAPKAVFHTDAIQAFGRIPVPIAPSPVDLVSISAHKVGGPKGVGALVVLNKNLLKNGLRPLIWGGDQEGGLRAGTQNAGLIAGFHAAAEEALEKQEATVRHAQQLKARLRELLIAKDLPTTWNSPESPDSVPHIVSLSVPGYQSGPLVRLMEERGCLVSAGSACHSQRSEPDPVLAAMGLPLNVQTSAIRISFSKLNRLEEVDTLVSVLEESIKVMQTLMPKAPKRRT